MECLPLHICIFCYNSSYNHNGPALCSCFSLPRVQPQFVGSGRTGLRPVACPRTYPPWYTARFTCCSRASRVDGNPSNPLPFFVNKHFRASLTWNKYQILSINKCKNYTITSSQEETKKINTHLAEVGSSVVSQNDKSFYGAQILLRNVRGGPCQLQKCTYLVTSGKFSQTAQAVLFPYPAKKDVVSHPVRAWEIERRFGLVGPRAFAKRCAGRILCFFSVFIGDPQFV